MKHQDIIKSLTLEEKAAMCDGFDYWHTKGIERNNIPQIMWTDGPHGIRKRPEKKDKNQAASLLGVPSICFPTAVTTACSWDPELLEEMGEYLGEECLQEDVGVLLGPGINMKRSPLGGRNFEYFSEDPYLAGKLAAALIRGVQSKGVGTSLKHFAVNNQETRRMTIDAVVDERTMREIYLSAFETAVKEGKPKTVMCMYNRLNGVYGAENKWLLTDVLKKEWGFEGAVVTDWGAENNRVEGLKAGEDLEMPTSNGVGTKKIVDAVKRGVISEDILDDSVDRILDVIITSANALKGNHHNYDKIKHHLKAREIAEKSFVLMKNNDNILPLKREQSIAVIGRFAKNPRYQGAGSSIINPIKIDNAVDSFQQRGVPFTYCDGYTMNPKSRKGIVEHIDEAVYAASQADVAVIFAGLPDSYESEGFDRRNLRLPPEQVALIEAVSSANKNTAVVLSGGGAVETPWAKNVKAILNTFLGGEAIGSATVNVLYGDVNPSGKLAETYPVSLSDTPCHNYWPGSTFTTQYRESIYIGYRYYDTAKKNVAFPFGFGLSYTDFEYSDLNVTPVKAKPDKNVTVRFKITNTGSVAGAEVAQVYVKDKKSTVFRPEKELKGFKKVYLEPGETKEVEIELDSRAFAFYDVNIHSWHVESGDFEIMAGASSRDIKLEKTIYMASSTDAPCPDYSETCPDYYGANITNIPDEEFENLLGRKLPKERRKLHTLSMSNTLEDALEGVNGKKIGSIIEKFADKNSFAYAIAMQTPIKNFVSMSMGALSERAASYLLRVLNDEKPLTTGLANVIVNAIPNLINAIPKLTKSI